MTVESTIPVARLRLHAIGAPTPAGEIVCGTRGQGGLSGGANSQLVSVALRPLESGSCHVPAVSSQKTNSGRRSSRGAGLFSRPGSALALCMLATSPASAVDTYVPFDPPPPVVQRLVDDVAGALRDPASARFGGFLMGKSAAGAVMVCGYVNAKNGFGGYSGMVPYFAFFHPETGHFQLDAVASSQNDVDAYAIRQSCAIAGLPI